MEWEPSRNWITSDLPRTRDHPLQAAIGLAVVTGVELLLVP